MVLTVQNYLKRAIRHYGNDGGHDSPSMAALPYSPLVPLYPNLETGEESSTSSSMKFALDNNDFDFPDFSFDFDSD